MDSIFLHICYPCGPHEDGRVKFMNDTLDYIEDFEPMLTIIHSTVPVGVTRSIYDISNKPIVHSPVRGRSLTMELDIKFKFVKFIGPADKYSAELCKILYKDYALPFYILSCPEATELGKLLCTSYYGCLIAFHQEAKDICRKFKVDFEEAMTAFSKTCTIDEDHLIPRPAMYVDERGIGGHCVVSNWNILYNQTKSDFIKSLLDRNEKTKERFAKLKGAKSENC